MKAVVSQQSLVSTQQTVGASLAPARNFKKSANAIIGAVKIAMLTLLLTLPVFSLMAQGNNDTTRKIPSVDMATGLRSNGKIYVVVAVLIIILAGLFFYLIRLDRKIVRLEKGENN